MNVLLVRADGIGDALVCAPLIAALRAEGHTVGAVLGTGNRSIFARDALAAVHVLERIPWPAHGSTPASYARALAEVRALAYDCALVASEEPEAYTFARAAGIAQRVGFINGWAKPFKSLAVRRTLTRAIARPATARRAREHEVAAIFRLGEGLVREAAPTRDLARLRAIVLGSAEANSHAHAQALVNANTKVGSGPIVLAASLKLARFGLDRAAFGALARVLRERLPTHEIAICGSDADLVRAVARDGDARSYAGLDVTRWKALIARAAAVITPDSGAAHVAGMLGVPTVDLFAPGPATAYDARRWAPWAAPHRTLTLDPTRGAHALAALASAALIELLQAAPQHEHHKFDGESVRAPELRAFDGR